jgi:hypothetical protein
MKSVINIKIVAGLAFVLMMISACTEDFDKMNTRNDLITEDVLNTNLMMTYVQWSRWIDNGDGGGGTIGNYPGMSISDANRPFQTQNGSYGGYSVYIRNLADLIRVLGNRDAAAGTNDHASEIAIARILKVNVFSYITDAMGDIPYFESCLPQEEVVYSPAYDTQESIYKDFFKELREAAAQLDESLEAYGSNDVLYGGDVAKWKKFANSLRLRLALRVRYVDATLASQEMSDLNESNLITSMEDNAYVLTSLDLIENANRNYYDPDASWTGLYNQASALEPRYVGKTVLDIWQDNFDPRLKLYCDTAAAAWPTTPGYETIDYFGYRGHALLGYVPVEQKYTYGSESCSRVSLHNYAPIWPSVELTAHEVYFALAEAALFGIKGSAAEAQGYYEKGVKAALDWSVYWNDLIEPQLPDMFGLYRPDWTGEQVAEYAEFHRVTQEEADAFVDTATVMTLTGTDEEQLEMIMNQKIVGFFPTQTQEAYAEWRRTGYPRVLVGDDDDALRGVSPRRYLYPDSEQQLNTVNLQEALDRMGGTDNMLNKVWWDKNPLAPHKHPGTVPYMDKPWVQAK